MTEKKRITVDVTVEEHRDLKVRLTKEGTSISKWLRALVVKFLGGNEA
jgi:hypothetical protein